MANKKKLTTKEKSLYKKMIKTYEKIVLADPKNNEAWYSLGVAYGELGRNGEARKAFGLSAKLDPTNPDTFYNLGLMCMELKRYKEAITAFKKSVKLGSDCAEVHYHLGTAFVLSQKFNSAWREIKILQELDPYLAKLLLIMYHV